MSNYVNEDTNFSNVTITNDYPCLVGGTWTAEVQDGKTVYVSADGTITYEGPVNLVGGNLIVSDGAVVDNLVIVPTGAVPKPTITVNDGGTLQNSTIFNATVNINTNGVSQNNSYVSANVTMKSDTRSSNDYFYEPGTTANASGKLELSQLPSGQSTSFKTSDGSSSFSTGTQGLTSASKNVTIQDPHFINTKPNNSTAPTSGQLQVLINSNTQFGDLSLGQAKANPDYDISYGYTLSNDNPVYVGGAWTATLGSDGKTYYTNGSNIRVEGPINLVDMTSLTIQEGAVVDGLTATQTGASFIAITNYGTIQNSFVANMRLNNGENATSQNNTFISTTYVGSAGSVTSGDYFYNATAYNRGNYNFSQNTSLSAFMLSIGNDSITLNAGASFDGSYVGTGSQGSSFYFTSSYGADVSCFLPGTMIDTVNGCVAIEDIQVGDLVVTYNGQQRELRSVIWKGYNKVSVNYGASEDEANYPVRILKDAISDGVPYKDLLVTSEHCFLFDGQFIPARMLVNGATIFYDHTITEYTYYHIETEQHSIIVADGVLTESYLDTGNRHLFYQDGNVVSMVNKNKEWNKDSAAPLVTTKELVEPIFIKLVDRAHELNIESHSKSVSTTMDSDLYLIANTGEVLYKTYENKGRFVFKIPAQTTSVQLISRTSKPSQMMGPFVDDRRNLGVLVGDVNLLEGNQILRITEHLDTKGLRGWYDEHQSTLRWTNGDAILPIRTQQSNQTGMLVINVVSAGPYIIESEEQVNEVQVA